MRVKSLTGRGYCLCHLPARANRPTFAERPRPQRDGDRLLLYSRRVNDLTKKFSKGCRCRQNFSEPGRVLTGRMTVETLTLGNLCMKPVRDFVRWYLRRKNMVAVPC